MLVDSYLIALGDVREVMQTQGVADPGVPDVVPFYTGWDSLFGLDNARFAFSCGPGRVARATPWRSADGGARRRRALPGRRICASVRCGGETTGPAAVRLSSNEALELWRGVTVGGLRRAQPDLTTRQLALLLQVYLRPPPHTVRGLARELNMSKPAVTRALDRLGELDFARRKRDEQDKRNVLVQRTVAGSVFLREFADMVGEAAQELGPATL